GSPRYDRLPGHYFGPVDLTADNVANLSTEGSGGAFGANAGFLWKIDSQARWSIGGVFRQGPRFNINARTIAVDQPSVALERHRVPDVYGLGVAYKSKEGSTKIAL